MSLSSLKISSREKYQRKLLTSKPEAMSVGANTDQPPQVDAKEASAVEVEKPDIEKPVATADGTADVDAPATARLTHADRIALLKTPRGIFYMVLVCFLAAMTYAGGFFMIVSGVFELLYDMRTHQSGHVERFLGIFPAPAERPDEDGDGEPDLDMVEWLSGQSWYMGPWTKPRWFILLSVGSFKFAHALGLTFADTLGAPFTYWLEQLASVCHILMLIPIHIGHAAIGDPVVATFVIAAIQVVKMVLKPPVHKLEGKMVSEDAEGKGKKEKEMEPVLESSAAKPKVEKAPKTDV